MTVARFSVWCSARVNARVDAWVHPWLYTRICALVHVCIYAWIHMNICAWVYTRICATVSIRVCTWVNTRVGVDRCGACTFPAVILLQFDLWETAEGAEVLVWVVCKRHPVRKKKKKKIVKDELKDRLRLRSSLVCTSPGGSFITNVCSILSDVFT